MEHPFHNHSAADALRLLSADPGGLSSSEVRRRLKQYGPNELQAKKKSIWKRLIEPFTSVFVMVLVVAFVLSLIMNERLDATVIGVILTINALIYYFQQASVERALKALRKHDKSLVVVRRDGTVDEVPSEQVVPGDIVLLHEGAKVPADGRLIETDQLNIDESVLTGESLPVHKTAEAITGKKEVYEQANMAFKGTFVYSGAGELLVAHTGNQTMLGKITTLATKGDFEKSPIEEQIDILTKKLISLVLVVGSLFFLVSLWRGLGLEEGLRYSVAVVVSAVPEGLPVAMTVILFLSAKSMAKSKALVKKISSMETLGAVTMIATDKTGTLTQNKLSVADMTHPYEATADFYESVAGSLNGEKAHRADVLDSVLAAELKADQHKPKGKKVEEYPFDQQLRVSGSLWQVGKSYMLYLKGAPEALLAYAKRQKADAELESALEDFAGKGYRNIAFAHKPLKSIPRKLDKSILSGLAMDGIVGLADGLRPGIASAIKEARAAGIKVVMLTGDHRVTAAHIAQEAGLSADLSEVAESDVLGKSSNSQIRKLLKTTKVFARVLPEYKYKFLQAVKGHEVTAMTGDGINDIPAIVEADVGLAMGSGTDATKEASDLVLLNNNFKTIITAIRMGRTVIANVRKMLFYLLSTNLGEAITMVVALVSGMPLPLTAAQILWINLVTDGMAVLPLGLSPSEQEQMKQPPRKPKEPILNFEILSRLVLVACTMATSALWLFNFYYDGSASNYVYANTMTFMALAACQWANALNANFEFRSWLRNLTRPNFKLYFGLSLAIILQMLVIYGPLQQLFGTARLSLSDLGYAMVPALLVLIVVDVHKVIYRLVRYQRQRTAA